MKLFLCVNIENTKENSKIFKLRKIYKKIIAIFNPYIIPNTPSLIKFNNRFDKPRNLFKNS